MRGKCHRVDHAPLPWSKCSWQESWRTFTSTIHFRCRTYSFCVASRKTWNHLSADAVAQQARLIVQAAASSHPAIIFLSVICAHKPKDSVDSLNHSSLQFNYNGNTSREKTFWLVTMTGGGIIIIIIIIIPMTMFMVLSSWPQGHCESSLGSFDECRIAPSSRRPSDQATWLGQWVRL